MKWLAEVMRAEAGATCYSGAWDSGDTADIGEVNIPLLVVGTKMDEANGSHLPLHRYIYKSKIKLDFRFLLWSSDNFLLLIPIVSPQ